jgi:hypothetical protein
MGGSHQMSSTAKQIVDRTMSREKTLGLSGGLERGVLNKRLLQRVERSARAVEEARCGQRGGECRRAEIC